MHCCLLLLFQRTPAFVQLRLAAAPPRDCCLWPLPRRPPPRSPAGVVYLQQYERGRLVGEQCLRVAEKDVRKKQQKREGKKKGGRGRQRAGGRSAWRRCCCCWLAAGQQGGRLARWLARQPIHAASVPRCRRRLSQAGGSGAAGVPRAQAGGGGVQGAPQVW